MSTETNITVTVRKAVPVHSISMTVWDDYWPEADADGEESGLPANWPDREKCIETEGVTLVVELATGRIIGWVGQDAMKLAGKICDRGIYLLHDATGEVVAEIRDGYVPNGVIPGEYGDYISLEIDATGRITNWPKNPDLSAFEEVTK